MSLLATAAPTGWRRLAVATFGLALALQLAARLAQIRPQGRSGLVPLQLTGAHTLVLAPL